MPQKRPQTGEPPKRSQPTRRSQKATAGPAIAPPTSARIRDIEAQIREVESLCAQAEERGLIREALTARATIARQSKDLEQERDALRAAAIEDPLERCRFMRERAEAAGSWVSATKLLADERAIIKEREAAAAKKREEEMEGISDTAIVEMLIEEAQKLPAHMRALMVERISG